MARLRIVMGTLAPLGLAACGIYGPCDHQRGIVLYARADGGEMGKAIQTTPLSMVAVWEHQRGDRREVAWNILAPPLRGRATAVHLHEGSASSGAGTLLFQFPIENAHPGDSVIQVTGGAREVNGDGLPGGAVPLHELMQRMYRASTYLEVHTDSVPEGEFRAQLGTPPFFLPPDDPAVWQAVYCS